MMMRRAGAVLAIGALATGVGLGQEPDAAPDAEKGPRCHSIRATLVEDLATEGCEPPHTSCFLGEVRGNFGLQGTTHFKADSGAAGPSTSPGWISYSGVFKYRTDHGALVMRETGVVHTAQGNPETGGLTAFQKVTAGTGEWEGATGHLFVSGFSIANHVETKVTGRLCKP